MTAPSNANTSGLSDACAQEEADTLASKLTSAEIVAASWKDRATAAEARADRLARAVKSAQSFIADGGLAEMYPGSAIYAELTAALQQETQP